MQRLTSCQDISAEQITPDSQAGRFTVHSSSSKNSYALSFGGDSEMPSCDCPDWTHSLLPCKHFLAVMQHRPEYSWSSFSEPYRKSPYFNVDADVVFSAEQPEDQFQSDSLDDIAPNCDLPRPSYPKKTKVTRCVQLLSRIKHHVYLTIDETAFDTAIECLEDALECLQLSTPNEGGLDLEKSKHLLKKTTYQVPCTQYRDIPKRKSLKNKFSCRVGEGVAIRREASKADVNLNLKQSKEASTIEEVAPLIDNFDEYDIESYILPKCFSAESSNAYEDPWIHVDEKNDSSSPATEVSTTDATDSQNMSTRKRKCTAKEKNSDEEGYQEDNSAKHDVIPNGYVPPHPNCTRPKRRKLIFSDVEKRKIQQNRMLTDESINIAQNLLYNQFDNIGGLEDTVVGQVKEFSVFTSNFIQIINTGMLHWICVSGNPAAEKSRVYIYDSLSSGTVTYVSAAQIANFMNCSESAITTTFQPVQQQLNGVDCGVFAIAFATSLAFGEDPTQIAYDNRKLRDHLIKCLERHEMRPFPRKDNGNERKCRKRSSRISLYCTCRMPWNSHEEDEDKFMAQCKECKNWFHRDCENIPDNVFLCSKVYWKCCSC